MSTDPPAAPSPTTVSLADEEAVKRILSDTLFGLWATVNNLSRLRPSGRERYRVTIFASARTQPGHWVYQEVKRMSAGLSVMGCDIVTGGGPGYIVAPGGIGTVLESMMIWQLLQVRHLHDTPLIFAGRMWQGLVDWASAQMLRPGFELANAEDMKIPNCVDGADEAIAIIREQHERWHAAQGNPA